MVLPRHAAPALHINLWACGIGCSAACGPPGGAAPGGGQGGDGQCRPHRPHSCLLPTSAARRSPGRSLAISTGCKSPPNKEPGWAQARFINMNAIESSNSPQSTQDRRQRVLLPENTRSHQLGAGGERSPGGGCSGAGADSVSVPCRGARPPGTPTPQPALAAPTRGWGPWGWGLLVERLRRRLPQGWGSLGGRTAAGSITLATPSRTRR